MIIAVGILVLMAVCALSLVDMGESHSRVLKILDDLDDQPETASQAAPAMEPQKQKMDVFSEVGFTRSLLALSKVGSPDPCEVPGLAHDESSSLVSVRPAQLKNRVQAL
jgi:hypothetical protein